MSVLDIERDDGVVVKCYTILDGLKLTRVFSVEKSEDGRFYFEEKCDGAFGVFLNKEQMTLLIDELRDLL